MIRRPPRSTLSSSSAASDVYKRQVLPTQHELNRTLDGGPQLRSKVDVPGRHDVVIEPRSHVRADVGVEPGVLHGVADVVVEPTAVAELVLSEPPVRRFGFV